MSAPRLTHVVSLDKKGKKTIQKAGMTPSEALETGTVRGDWLEAHNKTLGEKTTPEEGKWVLFVEKNAVDAVWKKIVEEIDKGTLSSAKVSINKHFQDHSIVVYVGDSNNIASVRARHQVLVKLGLVKAEKPIRYKLNVQSDAGSYGKDAFLYDSTTLASSSDDQLRELLEKTMKEMNDKKDKLAKLGDFFTVLQTYKLNLPKEKKDQINTADKMLKYLRNMIASVKGEPLPEKIEPFTPDELIELRSYELGDIISTHENSLPDEFIRAEAEKKKIERQQNLANTKDAAIKAIEVLNIKTKYQWGMHATDDGYIAQANLGDFKEKFNKKELPNINESLSKQLGGINVTCTSDSMHSPTQSVLQIDVNQIKMMNNHPAFEEIHSDIQRNKKIISNKDVKNLYQWINSSSKENEVNEIRKEQPSEERFDIAMKILGIKAKRIRANDHEDEGYHVYINEKDFNKINGFIEQNNEIQAIEQFAINDLIMELDKLKNVKPNTLTAKLGAIKNELSSLQTDPDPKYDRLQRAKKIIDEVLQNERKNYTKGIGSIFRNVNQFDANVAKGKGKYKYLRLLKTLSEDGCNFDKCTIRYNDMVKSSIVEEVAKPAATMAAKK